MGAADLPLKEKHMSERATTAHYDAAFLAAQRNRLHEERARLLSNIGAEEADLLSWQGDENSGVNQHPADDASALTEQEMDVTLIGNARYILSEIDEALARISDGTYGWDDEAGAWIREERLRALPWARREVQTQTRLEQRLRHHSSGYSHDTGVTSI
jgi:RNA polymerase-binding transcription factor DksA